MSEDTTTSELSANKPAIVANFNKLVDKTDVKFNFKKDELGNKRASVELSLPVPSVEGIVEILSNGNEKQLALLQEAVNSIILAQARDLVNEKDDISQDNFPFEKITWEYIANIEPKERRGGGIPKDTWEEFAKDYIDVMPAVTGKTAEAVGNAAKIFLNKFSSVKTNKPVITLLKDQLGLYLTNSLNAESYAECVDFLVGKAEKLLTMSDEELLKNL